MANNIDNILHNEQEWRKYLLEKVDEIHEQQIELRIALGGLKTWLWIWRAVGASFIAIIFKKLFF